MTTSGTATMTLQLLGRFGDAWNAADIDTLMTFVTDYCVYFASVGPEPGRTFRGRDEVRRGFLTMLSYDQGRERHRGEVFVHGDIGFAEWALEETTPQGHRRLIRGCDIFQFAGDKIRKKDAFRKVFNEEQMRMPNHSPVSAVAFADPQGARRHFEHRLACETDCADVWKAIDAGNVDFVLVDCRPAGNYAKAHLPGAISLPWSEIDEARVRDLPDLPVVTYCWGPSCNAATKGAYRLAALGREVKEMIGGLEYWIREGHPTEGKRPVERGQEKPRDWGLVV